MLPRTLLLLRPKSLLGVKRTRPISSLNLVGTWDKALPPSKGQWIEASCVFTKEDTNTFSTLTHDHNSIHREGSNMFGGAIVHGLLVASLIPSIFSTAYPGAIYRNQSLSFLKAVKVGDAVTCRILVDRVRLLKGGSAGAFSILLPQQRSNCLAGNSTFKFAGSVVVCATECKLASGAVAINGTATVMVPPMD